MRVNCSRLALMAMTPVWWVLFGVCALKAEQVTFEVTDHEGRPLPSLAIVSPVVQGIKQQPLDSTNGLNWQGYSQHLGSVTFDLEPGEYHYVLDRSQEYFLQAGQLRVVQGQPLRIRETLGRICQFRDRGWYAADLHVHRPPAEAEALIRAADLDLMPTITWWNRNRMPGSSVPTWKRVADEQRWISLTAGEDERVGGALLYFGLDSPIDITRAAREYPSPLAFVERAKAMQKKGLWIDIEKPFWWDVPTWIAHGAGNSIGICNNHQMRDQVLANEAWGKPRDTGRLPDPLGNGQWTQEIYYHLLNSGIRIPPSAGSASGVLRNPVGYNRVYVHLNGATLRPEFWWAGLAAGRCFVSNGPLLDCRINGQLPGSVFKSDSDSITVDVNLELFSRDDLEGVELIVNGVVAKRIPVERSSVRHRLQFQHECPAPSWVLVRAITDNAKTFRFASTGPSYIESPDQRHYVSPDSIRFFQTWVRDRMTRLKASDLAGDELRSVLRYHEQALEFWSARLAASN